MIKDYNLCVLYHHPDKYPLNADMIVSIVTTLTSILDYMHLSTGTSSMSNIGLDSLD